MEVKDTYILKLSSFQVEILMETVAGFVDNKKLLHIPDYQGKIVTLPLTMEVLQDVTTVMVKEKAQDPVEIRIELDHIDPMSKMKLSLLNTHFEYDVKLDEFDPL